MTSPSFWKLGLLGNPIAHSLSPTIHRGALDCAGLPGEYLLYEVEDALLPGFVRKLRVGELQGLNVTTPYKERILRLCDGLDPVAELVGAVNTLVPRDGRVVGYNTDVLGLETVLRERWPNMPWRGHPCVIQGAGGAAKAACVVAKNTGASVIRITNRTMERAQHLAKEMSARLGIECVAVAGTHAFADAGLVLQCASLGVNNVDRDRIIQDARCLMEMTDPNSVIVDLVYSPAVPPFILGARQAKRDGVGGRGMLLKQALCAFELWTGESVVMDSLIRETGFSIE
jgi:shikimate dehydrogenase